MQSPIGYAEQAIIEKYNNERNLLGAEDTIILPDNLLTQENLSVWTWLVNKGIINAFSGLSRMVGKEIGVASLDSKWLPASKVVDYLAGPENTIVGVYLSIEGDATGHLLLLHDMKMAFQLIDMQLGLPGGSTREMGQMEYSVLGEMGNITGSFFLNALADATSLVLMPSPPSVMIDMVSAVTKVPLTFIMEENDNALIVKATFKVEDDDLSGTFMVIPTMSLMNTVLNHLFI